MGAVGNGLVVTPEAMGAVGDGYHDDAPAIQAALDALAAVGGGEVRGDSSAVYHVASDVTITTPSITVDLDGAVMTGGGRILATGQHGARIGDIHVRGIRLRARQGHGCPRGPRLDWCEDSSITGIDREGVSGTVITVGMSDRVTLRDLRIAGGRDDVGMIGVLLWHCNDTLVECSELDGLGLPFSKALQVKGGVGNVVQDVLVHDVRDGAVVLAKRAFYDRGDAPWHASASTGPYPYPDGVWSEPDEQRASRGTRYIRCRVEDCDGRAWVVQESISCSIEACVVARVAIAGAVMRRLDGGEERDYHVAGLTAAEMIGPVLALISDDDVPITATVSDVEGEIYTENAEVTYG